MVFHSRKDAAYLSVMAVIILIIFSGVLLPVLLGSVASVGEKTVRIFLFSLSLGFLLWFIYSMKYTFHEKHLLVRGAFIRSRIPYENITSVSSLSGFLQTMSGFQMLTARSGLEISYDKGNIGGVKISPQNEEEFLVELQKRCPNMKVKNVREGLA